MYPVISGKLCSSGCQHFELRKRWRGLMETQNTCYCTDCTVLSQKKGQIPNTKYPHELKIERGFLATSGSRVQGPGSGVRGPGCGVRKIQNLISSLEAWTLERLNWFLLFVTPSSIHEQISIHYRHHHLPPNW